MLMARRHLMPAADRVAGMHLVTGPTAPDATDDTADELLSGPGVERATRDEECTGAAAESSSPSESIMLSRSSSCPTEPGARVFLMAGAVMAAAVDAGGATWTNLAGTADGTGGRAADVLPDECSGALSRADHGANASITCDEIENRHLTKHDDFRQQHRSASTPGMYFNNFCTALASSAFRVEHFVYTVEQ
jgi:hypothetical protein